MRFPKYVVPTRPMIAQMRWRRGEEKKKKKERAGGVSWGCAHRNVVVFASFV